MSYTMNNNTPQQTSSAQPQAQQPQYQAQYQAQYQHQQATTPPPTQMRFFTPSSPTPSDASGSQGPSSPIPAFVRMADEEALDGVTDDDLVKWCCYRDDEFMDVDEDDD